MNYLLLLLLFFKNIILLEGGCGSGTVAKGLREEEEGVRVHACVHACEKENVSKKKKNQSIKIYRSINSNRNK